MNDLSFDDSKMTPDVNSHKSSANSGRFYQNINFKFRAKSIVLTLTLANLYPILSLQISNSNIFHLEHFNQKSHTSMELL